MTEKRFIIMNNLPKGTHSNIWDKQKQHNQGIGDELWLGEVVAMLNEGVILADENEQLKSENKNLKSNVDDLMNMELEDRDIVCQAGKFRLEEWGKHRLHQFYDGDTPLEDETVVIRLMDLTTENEQLKNEKNELKRNYDLCVHRRMNDHNEVHRLEKENKELKEENEQLKKQLECSREEADDYCEELMGKDEFVRLYKRQRDDALEENKQLKVDNNRLVNETAKVVAEHQKKVLDLIDDKINKYIYKEKLYKHKGKDREASVFNLYCFCLNNLKKELLE